MTSPQPEPAAQQAPALPPVHEAWSLVMADVQAIGKNSRNDDQKYMFRGVDAVMNAVGPVLRKHGVFVMPGKLLSVTYRDVRTSRDKPAREVTVQVQYAIYGPRGDHMLAEVPGESMDFGDKGTAKAMSVAYRILLLQGLTIPTDEPEPDAGTYERANTTGPVVGADLTQARHAAAAAWAQHFGGDATPDAVALHFSRWEGARGVTFWDAEAGHVRRYAAYLSALPTQDAGSDPAARHADQSDAAKITPRQRGKLFALMGEIGLHDKGAQLTWINKQLGTDYESRSLITFDNANVLIKGLEQGIDTPPEGGEPA